MKHRLPSAAVAAIGGRRNPSRRLEVYWALQRSTVVQASGIRACYASDATLAIAAGLPSTPSGKAQVRRYLRELARLGYVFRCKLLARFGQGFRGGKIRVVILAQVLPDGSARAPEALSQVGTVVEVFGKSFTVAELGLMQSLEPGSQSGEVFARSARSVRSVQIPPIEREGRYPYGGAASRRGDSPSSSRARWPASWGRLSRFERRVGIKLRRARVTALRRLAPLSDGDMERLVAALVTITGQPWVMNPSAFTAHLFLDGDRWAAIRSDPANVLRPPRDPTPRRNAPDLSRLPDFLRIEPERESDAGERFWSAKERIALEPRGVVA